MASRQRPIPLWLLYEYQHDSLPRLIKSNIQTHEGIEEKQTNITHAYIVLQHTFQ